MQALLKKLNNSNIKIDLVDEKLDIQAPKGVMTADLLNEIKLYKNDLIEFISSYKAKKDKHQFIPQVPIQHSYVLSSSQHRLWLLSQLESASVAYNMPSVFQLKGNLDISSLKNAFQLLIERHESLRTLFKEEYGEVRQIIVPIEDIRFQLEYEDISHNANLPVKEKEIIKKEIEYSFDLSQDSLLHAKLIKTTQDTYTFVCVMHHIISDGWSNEVMIRELFTLYNSALNEDPLSPLHIQYKDYAAWQQNQLNEADMEKHKAYWLSQFENELPNLNLPTYQIRPAIKTYNGKSEKKLFSDILVKDFNALCQSQGSTLFMGLLAIVKVLFYKYTNQKDISIGSPIAGREYLDLQNQIGFYANTLALRTCFKEKDNFSDLLANVKEVTLNAYKHQAYPFDELVEQLPLKRDMSRNPLFDVMITLQNTDNLKSGIYRLGEIEVQNYYLEEDTISKFDLKFSFIELDKGLDLIITYNTDLYTQGFIERLLGHLETLLQQVTEQPERAINSLDYLSTDEKQQLLFDFNNTTVTYSEDKTLIDLFEEQAEKTPDSIAVIFEDKEFTYKEINELSNQLADYLKANYSISTDDLIGIKLERSELLIVSILGVLKSGAAYVPIDAAYPQERINYIEKDSNCKIVIDSDEFENFIGIRSLYKNINPVKTIKSSDLVYVIYTSGSTGNPKGVMIENTSLVNYLLHQINFLEIKPNERIALLASVSFDASVEQIFTALLSSSALCIIKKEDVLDAEKLEKIIEKYAITHLHSVPSLLLNLDLSSASSLKRIISAGENFKPELAAKYIDKYNLYNKYGPTETTISSTIGQIVNKDEISIGKPISNTHIYILNDDLVPVSLGIIGDMYISGSGLSRGYFNNAAQTESSFVSNPFQEGSKMYKTGDLGKWLPDGSIVFEGRKDFQVKIRGHRIELGEIENVILGYTTSFNQVVVDVREKNSEKVLVAYYSTDGIIDKSELRSYLQSKLPDYMVPGYYLELDSMPLTPNGKIDRKSLPGISGEDLIRREYVAPKTNTEVKLVKIWEEVLNVEKVGITDNFFELGGHSLIIVQIINKTFKELGKSISFKDFFANPTIKGLSKIMYESNYVAIPLAPRSDSYIVTSSQNRLWLLSQLEGGSLAYNMPVAIKLNGILNDEVFQNAFRYLINKHEILRTYFKINEGGSLRQFILSEKEVNFKIDFFDYEGKQPQDIEDLIISLNNKEFNLEEAPLVRASLLKISDTEHIFFFSRHHIIGDGWSSQIMTSEIIKIYNTLIEGKEIHSSALKIQYKDYAVWLKNEYNLASIKKSEDYWLEQFSGEIPVLELPGFKTRPLVKTNNGTQLSYTYSEDFLNKLKNFSKQQNVTLFMTLMAGINTLLYRYSGQKDIIIGTPLAGREHPDLENQIGLYLNTLAIRTQFKEENSFLDLIAVQKETLLEAYQYQNYPFDSLVDKLSLKRDTSRSVLFDVMVVLQNQNQLKSLNNNEFLNGLEIEEYSFERRTAQFDISFQFVESERLSLSIEYNTDIYDAFLINRIFKHFEQLLEQAITAPLLELRHIDYLSSNEKYQVVFDFNDTAAFYPKDKTILDLFEEQVVMTPNNIAIVFDGKKLIYEDLNEETNQLAEYLKENYAISHKDIVGIRLDRSASLIISILGVLKAGAAYVPIDPTYPQDRIDYIEKDSASKVIIDEALFEEFKLVQYKYSKSNVKKINSPTDLAYVIYTSGTTGHPKGVQVEHHNLINLCYWHRTAFKVTGDSRGALFSGVGFDASVWEIFPYLISGASLYPIGEDEIRLNLQKLADFYNTNEISHTYLPSAICSDLTNSGLVIEKVKFLVGGEALKIDKGSVLEIYNNYGPTENTVVSSFYKVNQDHKGIIPIGKPISNTQIYILDDQLQILPVGVTGKIYVSGASVARGYLNNEALTAEKFITNPFEEGKRMYDTGDLGRWLVDGNIEFLGRKDHQVKIRGYRIELGEIENTILEFSKTLKQVIVEAKELKSEKVLVAYIVTEKVLDKTALRNFLQGKLPDYMVPGFYIQLPEFPLTSNGKIDRKKLPEIASEDSVRKAYVAPGTLIEKELVSIWQNVLGLENIGITDNFFELGGHSLIISQVINRVQKQLGSSVSYKDFFANATISGLSKILNTRTYASIAKAPESEFYPLTGSQNRLWILSQLEGGSLAYNMPGALRLKGDVDVAKFQTSFELLIERHEILRTSFKTTPLGEVNQYIIPASVVNFKIIEKDLSLITNQQEFLVDYLAQSNNEPFDLEHAPLLRASIIKLKEKESLFFLTLHHIIGDGWSMEILISEVIKIYNALLEEKAVELPQLEIQYKDYAVWRNEEQKKEEATENYWLKQFSGTLPILELPGSNARPLVQTYNGANITRRFSKEFSSKLQSFSKQQDVTLFMTLMSGINALLYRYTGQDDIIIGTPIAGREHPDLENQIGLYLNTLAIRTRLKEAISFHDLLAIQKETLLKAYEHQNYSFDSLVGKLNLKRDMSRSALFDVLMVLQSQGQLNNLNNGTLLNLEVSPYVIEGSNSKFDITYTFTETDVLSLSINYNTDIYNGDAIERMFAHFENLVIESINQPLQALETINYLTEAEKQQLLVDFNDTKVLHSQDQTLVDLFEEQAAKTPDNTAIIFEDTILTYQQLNEKANQLAAYLRANYSIEPDDLIAIKLERNEFLLVSLLGVLKSGAAYVPIDSNYPQQRIDYIEKDSNSKVVIDQNLVEKFLEVQHNYSTSNLDQISKPNHLAYIIYTSGTTGNPKGVMVEHHNAVELIHWSIKEFNADKFDIVYAVTSHCFDLSVYEFFYTLSTGKQIRMLKNALEINHYLEQDTNILLNTVPSVVRKLIEDKVSLDNIKVLNMAGEILPTDIIAKLPLDKIEVRNLYGPSEDTTYSTSFFITNKEARTISIGQPISNTQVLILDQNNQLVPVGVTGRIFVSGAGVARGYLNKEELTQEKFVVNPFLEGERMYDTGDLGYWLSDGNIEFIGRKDHQVKIRGYRIELGEIESAVLGFSDQVQQAVLEAKEFNSQTVLVAYYVSETKIDKTDLRSYLQSKLPDYMLPGYFLELDKMPLTPNGKIDRKALPGISGEDLIRREYVAPATAIEIGLAKIWEEVLNIEKVGTTDNFFELGGHSLVVVQVINKTFKELGKSISFKDFFNNPTIQGLSKKVVESNYLAIPQAPESSSYPLTSSQNRFWILNQFEGASLAYNMPVAVKFTGDLDVLKLEEAFKLLIFRHEILRTAFVSTEGEEVRQLITPKEHVNFKINYNDFSSKNEIKEAVSSYLANENAVAFDLEKGGLVKGSLLKIQEKEHVFFMSMHHIVSDGWSMELLIKEIVSVYNSLVNGTEINLPELKIQYKDYAVWLNSDIQKQKYNAAEQYWINQFSGELPTLELPSFNKRPLVKTFNGNSITHQFSKEFLDQIKTFSKDNDATLFMSLLAGTKSLLYKYTNQRDIIIGTPIAGREHPDLENQVGLYLNTLAIRTQIEENATILQVLEKEKQALLEAYQYQNYPFDDLVGKLNLKRNNSRSALFDVIVVLQNQGQLQITNEEELTGLQVENYVFESKTAQLDMSFIFTESEEGLSLTIQYNTDIYDAFLIERIFSHFENLVSNSIANPSAVLDQTDYLIPSEKQQLLFDFNATEAAYPKDKTIVALFEEQVEKTPDNTAVVFENKAFTYQELNEISNQLAHYLRENYSIQADDLIGIKLERSENLIVSILGILKSGAAYVPIDPSYPQDRIDYIEKDSASKVIIDEQLLEKFRKVQNDYSKLNVEKINSATDLAYVIYTSGTTGHPKGVMVEHHNLINLCYWHCTAFKVDKDSRGALFSGVGFDASVWEIFPYLISGASLYPIGEEEIRLNLRKLADFYNAKEISHSYLPSAICSELTSSGIVIDNVKFLVGGEALKIDKGSQLDIYNNYGPTENTVVSTFYKVNPDHNGIIPIGKPVCNTQVYILGDQLQVLPIGVSGKIYVSGASVARGYLNNETLTSEKFIENPFVSGQRMYDTGDLGRWLTDGNVEFLGRKDHQVKIRGYRIELGEIENTILKFSTPLKQVIVEAKELNSEKVLVAYIVSENTLDKSALRNFLQDTLPDYMVPGFFVELSHFPLTSNGKIDRKALPSISSEDIVRKEYVVPITVIEKEIVAIWQSVLGLEKIGVTDNFFELGGHSLKAGLLINEYRKAFNVKIKVNDIFKSTTIKSHVNLLELTDKIDQDEIAKIPEGESFAVSAIQKRIWIASQFENGSKAYHMPSCIEVTINPENFRKAILATIERHEILRTVFKESIDAEIKQWILPLEKLRFEVDYKDYRNIEDIEKGIKNFIDTDNEKRFDLENGPLLRAALLQISDTNYVFYYNIHHIIGDGWSMEVLKNDVLAFYKAYENGGKAELEDLKIQHKDYVAWIAQNNAGKEQEYWLNKFEKEVPQLDLMVSKERPKIKTYNGNIFSGDITGNNFAKLAETVQNTETTFYMNLLSLIYILLYKYSYQKDLVIGSPIDGRDHHSLKNQIGCFVNTVPFRVLLQSKENYNSLLARVKNTVLEGLEHQSFPVESVIEALELQRDLSRSPLFDVSVVMIQNAVSQDHNPTNEQGYSKLLESFKSKLDLTFYFKAYENKISCNIIYNTDLFDADVIEKMFTEFLILTDFDLSNDSLTIDDYIATANTNETQEQASFFDDINAAIDDSF
ncbi:non-ribosomal peptide synthetase [Flavobacterium chilense]|uniref:Amino acid adenylation domain-containing protein n=1 Tax=Flavobacterium chilense TaxID=946677 RepID=A0A1M6XDI4_9FLAO|nr:non-ribosomal peptide synthetase [Flavobacterium chilense]SHL03865.1 amino acid adenylation domain-containing protein [Flavobacterium chilense]